MAPRWLACLLVIPILALGAALASAAGPSVETSYDPSEVALRALRGYTSVTIAGTEAITTPGAPELPVAHLSFVIPSDFRVEDVVSSWSEEELPGTHRVVPVQPDVPIGEPTEWVDPDPSIYDSESPYPANRVVYAGEGFLGGYRIATVTVYPVTYAPRTGKLTLARDLSVELVLAPAADSPQPRHRMTARSDRLYRSLVGSLVENPGDVAGKLPCVEIVEDVGPGGFDPRYTPSLEGSPVEYVIVTSDEFAPAFQEYADWKTKKGVPSVVRTVAWIEVNYPGGCDAAERIRMFLKDAFSSWGTTYVLLGGDTAIVPLRYAWTDYYGGWDITCDLYFSDLDRNWNADGDEKFGEAYTNSTDPGDSTDLYPDVFVGRAPVATAVEVETFLDKALAYEKAPDIAFAGRDLFLGEVIFPYNWQPGEEIDTDAAEHIIEPVLPNIPPEVHYTRLYQNNTAFPGSYPLGREATIDSMNVGYNITCHVGHANKDILRVSWGEYIKMEDVDALANGVDRSGFLWMLNCSTSAIEFDCISERFMNNPDGGASSLWGPSRYCTPATVRRYFWHWYDYLFLEQTKRAGVVCSMSKVPRIPLAIYDNNDRWTQLSYFYLGDPEVRLWRARPSQLTVIHDPAIPLGETNLLVSVSDPAAVDSALVCVMKEGEVYATGVTDASGQVTLSFTPETTGAMSITVTAAEYLPYEEEISVSPTAAAHLFVNEVTIDDDDVGWSDGNGNGRAEAGEAIELDIVVENGGQGGATNVSATLLNGDGYITLVDDSHYLGTIPPGTEVAFQDAFLISIADSCPNEYDVPLTFVMTDEARSTWQTDYLLRVFRPELVQVENDVDDGIAGNGTPDVGESVILTIDVLNEGNGAADLVAGVLSYPDSSVAITDSSDTWGDIAEGTTVTGSGGFAFDVVAPINEPFQLLLSDEDGKEWTHSFDLTRPAVVESVRASVRATTIYLRWEPAGDADLWGYNIYRTDHPAGTYELANDAVVERASYFEDAGLDEYTLYYYRVSSVDSSGNVGEGSEMIEVSTNPPAQEGWPLLGGGTMYGTPTLADIDLDGDLEVLVGSGDVYCWHHNGIEYMDGDGDPRTNGIFAVEGIGGYRSSLSVGEMDGDPYPEIVGAPWGNYGTIEDPEYRVYAWNADDGTVLSGWPVTTGSFCWATPALGDLTGDGLHDVVLPCADGFLYGWKRTGEELIDGDDNPATEGIFANLSWEWAYGSPTLADLDFDTELEIIVPSRSESIYVFNPDGSLLPGWPVWAGEFAMASPCVADLDVDGNPEIIVAVNDSRMFVFNAAGDTLPGWPAVIDIGGDFPPSPSVADLDGDGMFEIIQPNEYGDIYVMSLAGDTLQLWYDVLDGNTGSSVTVGDVDGDGEDDLLVAGWSGKIFAFSSNGVPLDGWPIQTDAEVFATPTLGDLDLDGDVEVVGAGMDGMVYVWDCEGIYADGEGVQWPTFRYDFMRTGNFGFEPDVGVAEGEDDARLRLDLEQNHPNPFNPVTSIAYTVPAGVSEIELCVYNLAGQLVRTLAAGETEPGRHMTAWNARDAGGKRVASGVYFVRLSAGDVSRTRKLVLLK